MILKLEEQLRDKLHAFYNSQDHVLSYHSDDCVEEDIKNIANWILRKWSEETGNNRTPIDDDH